MLPELSFGISHLSPGLPAHVDPCAVPSLFPLPLVRPPLGKAQFANCLQLLCSHVVDIAIIRSSCYKEN